METITVDQIDERLRGLSPQKLSAVHDFISHLTARGAGDHGPLGSSDAWQTMLATEAILRRDWDRPEEDVAWAYL